MQNVSEYLTQRIFGALAGIQPLEDFERWLYNQDHLTDKMNEEFYFDLFAFNYKGKDALYDFNALMKNYFGKQEHIKWKVKSWLEKVANAEKLEEEILKTFYELWCWDDLEFLRSLAAIYLDLEEYWNPSDPEVLKEKSSKLAGEILTKLKAEESLPGFNLSEFEYYEPMHVFSKAESELAENTEFKKKWWEFWK